MLKQMKPINAPPEEEWNFFNNEQLSVPDEQLIPMLHYEYARSAKWIVEAVQKLREGSANQSSAQGEVPKFAGWLAKIFPEFPKTAWLGIDGKVRKEKCKDMGFEAPWKWKEKRPPIQFISHSDPDEEVPGGPVVPEFFTILKINWQDYKDREIIATFADWLPRRRQELIRTHDNRVTYSNGKVLNDNRFFIYRKQSDPVGAGHPKRLYPHYLRQLGVTRMIRGAGGRWDSTAVVDDKKQADQAELQVAELLKLLRLSWNWHLEFTDVLDPGIFVEDFYPAVRNAPQLAIKQKKGKRTMPVKTTPQELRQFLDDQFFIPFKR